METDRAFDQLANEIISGLHLPHSCREFVRRRIQRAYAIGYDKGRRIYGGQKKPVVQLALDGTFIKEWESCIAAGRGLGFHNSCISRVCRKVKNFKTVGGFNFMYAEEYYKRMEVQRELNTISL